MTLKRALAATAVTACVAALLAGCADAQPPEPPGPPVVFLPTASGPDEVVLFNRFTQRLLTYDTGEGRVVEESNAPNYIQYGFPTASPYYTAGDSAGTGFAVVRVEAGSVEKVLELPDHRGVFPLATDGSRNFFTVSRYADDGSEIDRKLALLTSGGQLTEVPAVTGLIDSGAILDDTLYYSAYVEATNDYVLSSLALEPEGATPEVVAEHLPRGVLYVHDGTLLTSTEDSIVSGDESFECVEMCYFQDHVETLVRLRVSDQAGLALDLVDTQTSSTVSSIDGIVDFTIDGDRMKVYRFGGVDEVVLPLAGPSGGTA